MGNPQVPASYVRLAMDIAKILELVDLEMACEPEWQEFPADVRAEIREETAKALSRELDRELGKALRDCQAELTRPASYGSGG